MKTWIVQALKWIFLVFFVSVMVLGFLTARKIINNMPVPHPRAGVNAS